MCFYVRLRGACILCCGASLLLTKRNSCACYVAGADCDTHDDERAWNQVRARCDAINSRFRRHRRHVCTRRQTRSRTTAHRTTQNVLYLLAALIAHVCCFLDCVEPHTRVAGWASPRWTKTPRHRGLVAECGDQQGLLRRDARLRCDP